MLRLLLEETRTTTYDHYEGSEVWVILRPVKLMTTAAGVPLKSIVNGSEWWYRAGFETLDKRSSVNS